jgi:hypothetical protein
MPGFPSKAAKTLEPVDPEIQDPRVKKRLINKQNSSRKLNEMYPKKRSSRKNRRVPRGSQPAEPTRRVGASGAGKGVRPAPPKRRPFGPFRRAGLRPFPAPRSDRRETRGTQQLQCLTGISQEKMINFKEYIQEYQK